MFNHQRTIEVFGYDPENRTKDQIKTNPVRPRDLEVIDNCPSCNIERSIRLNQSRKNKPCSKCFHSTPEMQEAKRNQSKIKSEETKQRMRNNHWSKNGGISPFKGEKHLEKVKQVLSEKKNDQFSAYSEDELKQMRIKESCTKRGIPIEDFNGFSAPEGTRIRQSTEGKAWTYDVLSKANFTCDKCSVRGGPLHAHHKNAFNSFPEQRFDIDNGVCLCHDCHEAFHAKYGKGYNTIEQYLEFKHD